MQGLVGPSKALPRRAFTGASRVEQTREVDGEKPAGGGHQGGWAECARDDEGATSQGVLRPPH